jgi:hypothetical protein
MKNGPGYPGPFTFQNFSCHFNKYQLLSIPRTIKHLTICKNLILSGYYRPVGQCFHRRGYYFTDSAHMMNLLTISNIKPTYLCNQLNFCYC